ncbi:hypothetical protein L7F22_010078 [Adiantum nelumboides]|nr:hypothetical protein [Adiantum nelumboides]
MASAYAMSYLVKLEECVEPCVDLLVEQFERMVGEAEKSKASIDMAKWMHFFAMDAVGELAFGRGFEFLEKGSDPDNFLLGVSNLSHWGSMAGFLTPLLSRPARVVLKWLSGEPGGEVVGVATRARIDARYKAEAAGLVDRQDMLTKIIRAKHPSTGRQYDANDSLRTAISVVGAGSDTTSVALSAFFGYLVRNGKVYEDLQREIDEAFERGDLSLPAKYSKGVQLELLQACIKETLRLHPPISMSLPRLVPHGGDVIDGRFFPANTNVSVSSFVLHRTKEAFGDDAAEWNPYRWIGLDEQTRREMERVNLSFGAGNRQCIVRLQTSEKA